MNSKALIVTVVLVAALAGVFLMVKNAGGPQAAGDLAVLAEMAGTVTVNAAPAKKDMALKGGDVVEAGKDSFARIRFLKDGHEITLYSVQGNAENAKCEIKAPGGEGKTFIVNFVGGLLTFFVPPKEKRDTTLEIDSGEAIVSIHQTEGKVVSDKDNLLVALRRGRVGVTIGGKENMVDAGRQLVWDKKKGGQPEIKAYDHVADVKLYHKGAIDSSSSVDAGGY